jgi:rhamnosyl/mannosyltransferase
MSGRPLRVLQVGKFYPPHMGGIETHLANLCGALRTEVELAVVVAADGPRTVAETVDGVEVTRLGTRATVASAPLTPGLARHIGAAGADLVHVHLPHPTAVLSCLAARHRGALVATYHSDIVRQRLSAAAFAPFGERFYRRAAALVATSPDYAASSPVLRRHAARVRVIPYGIPAADFAAADPAAVAALRERFGPRLVLAVGRLIYYKGFEVLIRAMRRVDGRLAILGDGPLRRRLEQTVAEAGVGDKVTLAGEVPNRDIAPWYHAAAVYALPSIARSEAFGIVQLEAMASGVPVVNTALDSGVPFVSRHGECGLTVPPGDLEALAAALGELLDDPERARRLGEAGRARVLREFTVEAMARRTLELYREVAARDVSTSPHLSQH